jgi:thioesterase domain-containing protein
LVRKFAVRLEAGVAVVLPWLPASRARRLEQIAAAHEKAYAQYDPPPYRGRVALFRAARQPAGRASDRSLGWADHVTGTLDIYDVPGHRIGLLSEPRVGPVAREMVAAMEASTAVSPGNV